MIGNLALRQDALDLRSERQRRHDALTRPERTQALVRDLHADLDYYRSE